MIGFPVGGSDRFSGNHQLHDIGQFLRIWQKISGHFHSQEKQEIALHADHGWAPANEVQKRRPQTSARDGQILYEYIVRPVFMVCSDTVFLYFSGNFRNEKI